MNMYADYTWTSDEGYSGTWTKTGKDVVVTYASGTTYTGVLSANNQHASGTMVSFSGMTGCWTADRL